MLKPFEWALTYLKHITRVPIVERFPLMTNAFLYSLYFNFQLKLGVYHFEA